MKLLRNIENSRLFNRFLQLCAGRIGQQLNVAAISIECGIDVKTVNACLGILQSSYIVHLLPPCFNSFNKRIVKTPKLYFIDTGLACSLLSIRIAICITGETIKVWRWIYWWMVVDSYCLWKSNRRRPSRKITCIP